MIGETIKIGFDGSAVKRGLAGIMGGFNKVGRGIGRMTRQVGIGGARRLGSDLFGAVVSGLKAIPNELEGLARLNKELDVMSQSTGTAAKEYLALREAIAKTTGRDAEEAGDFLRDVSERIGEGLSEHESETRKAMREMGIVKSDLQGLGIDEQMKVISNAFQLYQGKKGPAAAMTQINKFLGEVGKQMIPLFLNYEKGMDSAREKTAGLANQTERLDGALEGVFDIRRALSRKFSEFSLGVLEGLDAAGFKAKSIAEFIEGFDVAGKSKGVADVIGREMDFIKQNGIWEWIEQKLSDIGAWLSKVIGEAITNGIKNAMPDFSFGGLFKGATKDKKPSVISDGFNFIKSKIGLSGVETSKIEQNTQETNRILEKIADNGIAGVYA